MRVIFLDIDGVLNNSKHMALHRGQIDPQNIACLNHLVEATGAKIVLSSSWRSYVGEDRICSIQAFALLLHTHGLRNASSAFLDTTRQDVLSDAELVNDRAYQCKDWLDTHPEVTSHVALDDCEFSFEKVGINHVKTEYSRGGLLMRHVHKATHLLLKDKS